MVRPARADAAVAVVVAAVTALAVGCSGHRSSPSPAPAGTSTPGLPDPDALARALGPGFYTADVTPGCDDLATHGRPPGTCTGYHYASTTSPHVEVTLESPGIYGADQQAAYAFDLQSIALLGREVSSEPLAGYPLGRLVVQQGVDGLPRVTALVSTPGLWLVEVGVEVPGADQPFDPDPAAATATATVATAVRAVGG